MSGVRRRVVQALDSIGVKRPIQLGLNRLLVAAGKTPRGANAVFHDLARLAATPRPRPAERRGRLLFLTMRGWSTHVALETLLGEAAAQRGIEPVYLTCGGPLPLCGITSFRADDPTPCADCHGHVSRYFEILGFPCLRLDELVDDARRSELSAVVAAVPDDALSSFVHDGLPLGELVQISVKWFLLRGSPEPTERWLGTLRGFLTSAILMQEAIERLFEQQRPDRVVCLNGLFFAERIFFEIARRREIPVTTYERGFMPGSWVFRHEDAAGLFHIKEDFLRLAEEPLDVEQKRQVDEYLDERSRGGQDATLYWPRMDRDRGTLEAALELDPSRPVVSIFTNITWDSAVQGQDVAFDGPFDWLEQTLRWFARDERAQLVLRIHPAEVRLPGLETTERVIDTLAERMGGLPPGLRVIPAESELSSYTLGRLSRAVLVYNSTMGLEMACAGLPVVVAGRAHYRDLGFTIDVAPGQDYPALLDRLLDAPTGPVDAERARRYAHFLFFRYMVPLGLVREEPAGRLRIPLAGFDELGPGRDAALDAVMDGLIEGKPIFC